VLVVGGVLIGIAGVAVAGKFVEPLLYETSPFDPSIIAIVIGVLLMTALTSSISPAMRARRVDPNSVLREE
jgi:ABC-type lipoprotein release transport system permease subunit